MTDLTTTDAIKLMGTTAAGEIMALQRKVDAMRELVTKLTQERDAARDTLRKWERAVAHDGQFWENTDKFEGGKNESR